jgi:hypothetical protein
MRAAAGSAPGWFTRFDTIFSQDRRFAAENDRQKGVTACLDPGRWSCAAATWDFGARFVSG